MQWNSNIPFSLIKNLSFIGLFPSFVILYQIKEKGDEIYA
jgi:hypothetical protein